MLIADVGRTPYRQEGETVVIALLVNGQLAVFRDTAQAIMLDLATDSAASFGVGRFMARGAEANTIHVLTHDASFLTVRLRPLSIIARQRFQGQRWASLARAANGDLYLFGNAAPGLAIKHVDATGRVLHDWKVQLDTTGVLDEQPLEWSIYLGGIAADGRRLYVGYHGSNTTGVDWFDLRGDSLFRCPTRGRSWVGCVGSHGGFAVYKGGLLFATGFEVIGWTDFAAPVPQGYDTRLLRDHLMEFAIDSARGRLYAIGSCSQSPRSYSVVDLTRPAEFPEFGPTRRLWKTEPPKPLLFRDFSHADAPCGQRIVLGEDSLLYVIQNEHAVPFDQGGSILVLDPVTGDVRRRLRLPSEAVDVLVLRRPRSIN